MTKNVLVTDCNGRSIGYTYPKRAKGLVKNGRAEALGDCEIRLRSAHVSSVSDLFSDKKINFEEDQKTEEKYMSQVLSFDAKDFDYSREVYDREFASGACFAKGYPYAAEYLITGGRFIRKDPECRDVEGFEIGNTRRGFCEISAVKEITPDTDYMFRFAVIGGIRGRDKCFTRLYVQPEGEEERVYALEENLYKPVFCRLNPQQRFIRVFEVPIHSKKADSVKITFTAAGIGIELLPAEAVGGCEEMEDISYEEWLEDQEKRHGKKAPAVNIPEMPPAMPGIPVPERVPGISFFGGNETNGGSSRRGGRLDLSGASLSMETLEKILSMGYDDIDLSGCSIED